MTAYDNPVTIELARLYSQAMTPARQSALDAWGVPSGSTGLDVGCGSGTPLIQLARRVGPSGSVTGLDNAAGQMELARQHAAQQGLSQQIALIEADFTDPLPFANGAFDWAWSENALWSTMLGDDFQTLREIARAVRPGGTVALLYGNMHRAMMLPGHLHLEHKLYLADALRWFDLGKMDPDRHFDNASQWLKHVGLQDIRVSTHLTEYAQPIPEAARKHLELSFAVLFGEHLEPFARRAGMTSNEWEAWRHLSDPQSPEYILARDDYRMVRIATLTRGRVPPI
jgi:demethylmenaquinone methyltransferase/2-methoxy-6-polyprenyl-1,4-benzoquinol methylase